MRNFRVEGHGDDEKTGPELNISDSELRTRKAEDLLFVLKALRHAPALEVLFNLENNHKTFHELLFQLHSSCNCEVLVVSRRQPSWVCDDSAHTRRRFHDHRSPHGWMLRRHWLANILDAATQPSVNEAD